jgi:hypothetical protein
MPRQQPTGRLKTEKGCKQKALITYYPKHANKNQQSPIGRALLRLPALTYSTAPSFFIFFKSIPCMKDCPTKQNASNQSNQLKAAL